MIGRIEELLMDGNPSANTGIDSGFLLRSHNVPKLPTINFIKTINHKNISKIVDDHCKILKKNNIQPRYRILETNEYQDLEVELVRRGFESEDPGNVVALNIENMERELFAFANFIEQGTYSTEKLEEGWLEDYKNFVGMSDFEKNYFEKNINNSLYENGYFAIIEKGRIIAMGYVTYIDSYMIINDIVVLQKYMNMKFQESVYELGYDKKILMAMLCKGLTKGCNIVIADVPESNSSLNKLFSMQKFEKIYRYYYRTI